MIEIPQKIIERIHAISGLDLSPHWTKFTVALFRFQDDINLFRFKKNLLDGELPIYDLKLSPNDLRHLNNLSKTAIRLGYLPNNKNSWRSSKIRINGEEYNVEVRMHGDSPPHWSKELKSYQVKTEKKGYINNMWRFNIILFEDRFFSARIQRFLSQYFGLEDVRDDFIVLRINGVTQGLYYLQEKFDSEFLEYNECPDCYAIKLSDNWVEDHPYNVPPYQAADENGIFWANGHVTPFDYEIANLNIDETLPNSKAIVQFRINELYNSVKENNPDVIEFFDMDQLSSFEAVRMLLGHVHIIAGDNLRMIYRQTNGKFYPIVNSENIYPLKLQRGGFEHYLNTFGTRQVELFYNLNRNNELRHLRNKKVYNFITNNTLIAYYSSLLEKYQPYATSYKTNRFDSRHLKFILKEDKNVLENNMKKIKENLEYSKAYFNVLQSSNKIKVELIPDSISQIKFDKFKIYTRRQYRGSIEFTFMDSSNNSVKHSIVIQNKTNMIDLLDLFEGKAFSAGLDESLYPAKRSYYFEIYFANANEVYADTFEIVMRNDVTGSKLDAEDIYLQIADGNNYYNILEQFSFDKFKKEYPAFNWVYDDTKNEITLVQGNYILDKNMIIPKTNGLILAGGVNIKIAAGQSVVSYSPVKVLGTKEYPVVIKALDKDKPFGTFAIIGEGKEKTSTVINWLDFSGGNESWVNGMYFSGQLAINYNNVLINNSKIHGSYSDDGINIKYANILIDNSAFYDNNMDQADLDFVEGVVKNSEFRGVDSGIGGGDGLDLSGSTVLIKNNRFLNSLDKGLSIGEETKALLFKNEVVNNNIGTAVKDSSEAYFLENSFKGNKIAVDSYQKKQLFGGSFSYLYNNAYSSNWKDLNKDDKSKAHELSLAKSQYLSLVEDIKNDLVVFP